MPFRTSLRCEFIALSDEIILTAPLIYYSDRYKRGVNVRALFISDGASIPKVLWSVIGHPFSKHYRKQAVLHDWLYRTSDHGFTRNQADLIFYDSLREEDMGFIKASMLYLGVRVGGWKAWDK